MDTKMLTSAKQNNVCWFDSNSHFLTVFEVSQHMTERLDLNHWRQVDL